MAKNVLDRCCGNCDWSISPDNEEDIMNENDYEEDDPTRPRAGDCCLGINHNGSYVCPHHEYIAEVLDVYAYYDNKYLGQGFFIVLEYNENIVRFLKLYRTAAYGNYDYGIRAFESDTIEPELSKGITYEINKLNNEALYNTITIFAKELSDNIIWDINKKNFMTANVYEATTCLLFTGSKDSNFIDIRINSSTDDRIYRLIEALFRNMAAFTSNLVNYEVNRKIKKLIKKNNL